MARKVRKNNRLTSELRLNSRFYKKTSVLQAIEDFHDVCSCKFEERDDEILVVIRPKIGLDPEMLGYEFSNYVIGLMKNLSEV